MSLGWQLPPLYETLKTFTSVFVYQKKKSQFQTVVFRPSAHLFQMKQI